MEGKSLAWYNKLLKERGSLMTFKEGVNLHFINNHTFKTNHIKVRFSCPLDQAKLAERSLIAALWETANQDYPTSRKFREKLASMYGASFTTSISRKGQVSILDIDIAYVKDQFLSQKYLLTNQVMTFLSQVLFRPLLNDQKDGFNEELFELEKRNLLAAEQSNLEDPTYLASQKLKETFYLEESLKSPECGSKKELQSLDAKKTYSYMIKMLERDQIDLYFLGEFNQVSIEEHLGSFDLQDRKSSLQIIYKQETTNITKEVFDRKDFKQSILELGFSHSSYFGERDYPCLMVLNSLLGAGPHSKLFRNIREKEGLAYSTSSLLNPYTGLLRVYAAIKATDKNKVFSLILKELKAIKTGKVSQEELRASKELIKNNYLLSLDQADGYIERVYLSQFFNQVYKDEKEFISLIDQVSVNQIKDLAQTITLQAVYFLEGKKDES